MRKITPMARKTKREVLKVYKDLYGDIKRFIDMKLKFQGVHNLIVNMTARDLKGKSVLDIGCGFGRLSFLASRYAKHVNAIDMMEPSIRIAKIIREALGLENIDFKVLNAEKDCSKLGEYDFVFLSGVLEHMLKVDKTFNNINKLLKKSGKLLINCPGFHNPRGDIYMAFLKLYGYPMSLTDIRQVDFPFMKDLAKRFGYEIIKTVGVFYDFGWGQAFAKDMTERMSNVFSDVGVEISPSRKKNFDTWLEERAKVNEDLMQFLYKRGTLKKIRSYKWFRINEKILSEYGLPVGSISTYLKDEPSRNPYYCDTYPFNLMGGETLYILKKKA
jgi:SAM-dependent methyltransferase